MAQLSITQAWNETAEFVKREARLLFPVAFLLVALPGAIVQLFAPPALPGSLPEPGMWMLLMPVTVVVAMIGTIALSYLALRPGASVGEALQVGARRFIFLLAASLLVGLGMLLVLVPLVALAGGLAFAGGPASGAAGAAVMLMLFLFMLAAIALWVRLVMMTPVAAVERAGPIAMIRRSWELTRGHFWRLLGFVLLVLVAALVVMLVIGSIAGIVVVLIAGRPEPLTLPAILLGLVGAAVQAVFSMIFATLIARIYAQLSGGGPGDVFV